MFVKIIKAFHHKIFINLKIVYFEKKDLEIKLSYFAFGLFL